MVRAPEAGPVERQQYHYDWHWQFPFGNGDFGNQGVHQVDLCRRMLGVSKLPRRIVAVGGRFGYEDDGTTRTPCSPSMTSIRRR